VRTRPSFNGLRPASDAATAAARGSSKKADTAQELKLRRALWSLGLRYRKNAADLPGRPDVVFRTAQVVVFCDGDFWHGRDWEARKRKLREGHNAPYWLAKIERNIERDRERTAALEAAGWKVLRFWETEIHRDANVVAQHIASVVAKRLARIKTEQPRAAHP
jgi:DNA mismatch endonuclease (patch repair protein)